MISKPSSSQQKKDEGILKILSMHILDKESQKKIILSRIKEVTKEKKLLDKVLSKIADQIDNDINSTETKEFSQHVASEAVSTFLGLELTFAQWLLYLYNKKDVQNYSDYKFADYIKEKYLSPNNNE